MTGAELIAAFRDDTGDTAVPPSWSDSEVLRGLNEGQDEAARRARLLFDSTTVSVCQTTVTHDNPIVTLDPRVIFLRRARLNGQSIPLIRKRVRDMDQECPGWDSETTTTTPQIYIPDYQTGAVRLYPTPKDDGTLLLTVIRLPIAPGSA